MEFESGPDRSTRQPTPAELDAATAALRDAFAAGRLTLEEFHDRVSQVLAADNLRDLDQATTGVVNRPLIGGGRAVSSVVAFLGNQSRAGRWRLSDRLRIFAVLGDVHLDLGSAVCAEETVEIGAWSLLGEINLVVPDGVEAELSGFDLFGSRELRLASTRPVPGTPRIRVRARAAFGAVSVRSPGGGAGAADGYHARGGLGRRRLIFAAVACTVLLTYLLWPKGHGSAEPAAARPVATPSAAPSHAAPDVVGKRLSDAQADFAAAGFDRIKAVDASSDGRIVLNPQNWIVKEQSPAAGIQAPMTSKVTLKVTKPSDKADQNGDRAVKGLLPNVVCMDLATAEERLRAAGFTHMRSQDGTSQDRLQILGLNWVVTGESPAGGHRYPADTQVVLTTVKYGEPTGASGCPN